MKKKILAFIVSVFFILPCMFFLAGCNDVSQSALKIVVNNKTFTISSTESCLVPYGTTIDFEAFVVLSDETEEELDTSLIVVTDESEIIGTAPDAGTYELGFKYDKFEVDVTVVVTSVELTVPTANVTEFDYNGSAHNLEVTGLDSTLMQITGNSYTNAGNYFAVVSLKDKVNYTWTDGTTQDKSIAWSIAKVLVEKPTIVEDEFTYTGGLQNVQFEGFDADLMNKVSGVSGLNASNYSAVISLKDTTNYAWVGGSVENLSFSWKINKAQAVAPAHAVLSGTYDEEKTLNDYTLSSGFSWVDKNVVPTVNKSVYKAYYNGDTQNFEDVIVDITLNIAKAQAVAPVHTALSGTYDEGKTLEYYVLNAGYSWVNKDTIPTVSVTEYNALYNPDEVNYISANTVVTLNLLKKTLVAPSIADVVYTYNGSEQVVEINNSVSDYFTISGTTSAINADDYGVFATITNNNYCFAGNLSTVELTWTIAKKEVVVTLDRALSKAYDGLNLNNPRFSVTDDVESSYKLLSLNGEEPIEVQNVDIVDVGYYQLVVTTQDDSGNYENANTTFDFNVYYDISKLSVYLSTHSFAYTGKPIIPEVAVSLGTDGEENPILLSSEYYDIEYYNNVKYYDDSYVLISAKGNAVGQVKVGFTILPTNIYKSVTVNGNTTEIEQNQNNLTLYLDSVPTQDLSVGYALNELYVDYDCDFIYYCYNEDDYCIVSATRVQGNVLTIPKETRTIKFDFTTITSEFQMYTNESTLEVRLYVQQASEPVSNSRYISDVSVELISFNHNKNTVREEIGFAGESLLEAIEYAVSNNHYQLSWELDNDGYVISAVAKVENNIVFTITAQDKKDIICSYEIVELPVENSYYLTFNYEMNKFYIDGYNNNLTIYQGYNGSIVNTLNDIFSSSDNYLVGDTYAQGYIYSKYELDNGTLKITLSKSDASDIVLVYDVIDYTNHVSNFVYHISNDDNVEFNFENAEIILPVGYSGDILSQLQNLLSSTATSQLASPYLTFTGASLDENIITLTFNYYEYIEEQIVFDANYSVTMTVVQKEGYATIEEMYHDAIDGNRELLAFDSNNTLTITNTMNYYDSIYISIDDNNGATTWVITNSNLEIVAQSQGYSSYALFNIPYADTFTLTLYSGSNEFEYTIVIENFDDTPGFVFTYNQTDYEFNMYGESDVLFKFDMKTYTPDYIYTYLGSVEEGTEFISISVESLFKNAYAYDGVTPITDYSNIVLPILVDKDDNQYCLLYVEFVGKMLPVYFYLFDAPVVDEDTDFELNFAKHTLKYSLTPKVVEDVTYYGDFVAIDSETIFAVVTKEQIDYIDGDSTILFEVDIYNQSLFMAYNMFNESSILYSMADHSGVFETPIIVETSADPEPETVTYLMFMFASRDVLFNDTIIIIQIVDELPSVE